MIRYSQPFAKTSKSLADEEVEKDEQDLQNREESTTN